MYVYQHVQWPHTSVCLHVVCWSAVQTYFKILTTAVTLLITSIQTVIISITLPQSPYAMMIMALELITFTSLWLQTTAGGFWEKQGWGKINKRLPMKYEFRGNYWHRYNGTKIMLIMYHDPMCNYWDLIHLSGNSLGLFPTCIYLFISKFAYE